MKILIAIDFSENSIDLIERTVNLLRGAIGSVCLLHVAEPEPEFVGYTVDPTIMRDQVAEHFHEEHVKLQAMASALREQGIEAKALLIQGETENTLVEQAEKLGVDLIVVGSSEHGALYRFFQGDTIKEVLQDSDRPVLVMPVQRKA